MRVAAMAADGSFENSYPVTRSVELEQPGGPWAMNLADVHGAYWYVCFDLDAGRGRASYDAGKVSLWLDELAIEHTVVQSGPTGGRHVWISLAEGVPAAEVAAIAQLAAQLLPSLDISPLSNPSTGCVRPPGAPHRRGGVAVARSVEALLRHAVTRDQLLLLHEFLVSAGATVAAPSMHPHRRTRTDADGMPYLEGARREPSSRIRSLMGAPADAGDLSPLQATVLAGLARARWRYSDVEPLLDSSPALEHARSRRTLGGRAPRPRREAVRALQSAWRLAVQYVAAAAPNHDASTAELEERAQTTYAAIDALQARADAVPGHWVGRTGAGRPSQRAVLDAVCAAAAEAIATDVEIDLRRLAIATGYSREACRLALAALCAGEKPWLAKSADAHGLHGARYRLPEPSTGDPEPKWSQVMTPPDLDGPTLRQAWLHRLQKRLAPLRSDTFAAPRSLGRARARLLIAASEVGHDDVDLLAARTALPTATVMNGLVELSTWGLYSGRSPVAPAALEEAAVRLGVSGYLSRRIERYTAERTLWSWWRAEHDWMRRRGHKPRRRPSPDAVALFSSPTVDRAARYPRGPNGRADHRAARRIVKARVMPDG